MWAELVIAKTGEEMHLIDLEQDIQVNPQGFTNSPLRRVVSPVTFWAWGLGIGEVVKFYYPKNRAVCTPTYEGDPPVAVWDMDDFVDSGVTLTYAAPCQTLFGYIPILVVKQQTSGQCYVCYSVGG